MKKTNQKGGAAIVAILIVIILVAVGSAALVVTGRNTIQESKETYLPQVTDSSEDISETDSSSITEESSVVTPTKDAGLLPAANYDTISIKGTAAAAILVDAETNEIVAGYKYDQKIYPASLTKMLTLLVACENIDDLEKTYTFTAEDIDPLIEDNASRAGFEAGETVTMSDLLYASILVSGADGTIGLANSIAGSEKAFVELMNTKAAELGLEGTSFVNASGLHSKKHYSTVEDLAAITKACLDNKTAKKVLEKSVYTTTKTKQHEDGIQLTSIVNSRFAGYYVDRDGDGEADSDVEIEGGKTGFTDEALYTLATICTVDGHDYICVTAKSSDEFKSVEDQIMIYEKYLPGSKVSDTTLSDDTSSAAE